MAIAMSCPSCDRELKVKDELAGRKIKCPKCKEVITVLDERVTATARTAAKKKRPAAAEEDEDEDDEPEEEERPKKKKKKKAKSKRGLLIGSAVGVLVLIVVVVVIMMMSGGGTAKEQVAVKKPEPPPVKPAEPAPTAPEKPPPLIKKAPAGGIARSRERTTIENDLRQLGLAFRQFDLDNGRGPKDQKEFEPYYSRVATITDSLTNKWITVPWGVGKVVYPDGASQTILAFETDPDLLGNRFVVHGDGSVTFLDNVEFLNKPKLKGK